MGHPRLLVDSGMLGQFQAARIPRCARNDIVAAFGEGLASPPELSSADFSSVHCCAGLSYAAASRLEFGRGLQGARSLDFARDGRFLGMTDRLEGPGAASVSHGRARLHG